MEQDLQSLISGKVDESLEEAEEDFSEDVIFCIQQAYEKYPNNQIDRRSEFRGCGKSKVREDILPKFNGTIEELSEEEIKIDKVGLEVNKPLV